MARTILHLDVDNFYVAVERADDPSLEGVPVAVVQQNSGGIVALSNEAKAAGLRKGDGVGAQGRAKIAFLVEMSSVSLEECRRLCPHLVIKPMRVERYRQVGVAILRLLQRWSKLVEKTSYDDFYMDVTATTAKTMEHVRQLPPRTSVASCGVHSVPFDGLPVELQHSCKIAAELRAALCSELGLAASVGIGRTKLSARMLSPQAKPDGICVLPDSLAAQFFSQCRLLQIPSFQAQRGRAIAEKFLVFQDGKEKPRGVMYGTDGESATAGRGQDGTNSCVTLEKLKSVTLGDLISVGQSSLTHLIGQKDAEKIFNFADGGNDGDAAVLPRGPPKSLASEASFPPTDDAQSLQVRALELATVLWQRLLADSMEHNIRIPRKLVVTWRRGYADNTSAKPTLSTVSPSKGVQHSRGVHWPPILFNMQRAECSTFKSTASEQCSQFQVSPHSESVKELAGLALRVLFDTLSAPRQITRLILSVEFGNVPGEQTTTNPLEKLVGLRKKEVTMPSIPLSSESDVTFVSERVPPLRCSPLAACDIETADIDSATLAELPPSIRMEIEDYISAEQRPKQQSIQQSALGQHENCRLKRKSIDLKEFFSSKRVLTPAQTACEVVVVDD